MSPNLYCPQCGHVITLDAQKFCNNCGFDLSGLPNTASRPPAGTSAEPVTVRGSQPGKIAFWKKLNGSQIAILVIGILICIPNLVLTFLYPSESDLLFVFLSLVFIITLTLLLIYLARTRPGMEPGSGWGWGWYLLSGFVYQGLKNTYTEYGLNGAMLQLLAVALALFIYFWLRKKYFKNVKVLWRRSLYCGLIAYVISISATSVIAQFIPTQAKQMLRVIEAEDQIYQDCLTDFNREYEKRWSAFIASPTGVREYQVNLEVTESVIPIYKHKDSVLISALTNIYSAAKNMYAESPSDWSLTFRPEHVGKLVDKAREIQNYDQITWSSLSSYYNSLIFSSGDDQEYWDAYQQASKHTNVSNKEYSSMYNEIFGKSLSKKQTQPQK